MKKIFLATTALAAVGMVSPAIADVNLSAYYELGWSSRSDDTPGDDGGADSFIFSDTEVHIKFDKVSDSGLEYGAAFELETGTTQGTDVSVDSSVQDVNGDFGMLDGGMLSVNTATTDESSLYIKGDFGRVVLGQNDYAHSSFLTWSPTHRGTFGQDDSPSGLRFATPDPTDNSTSTSLRTHANNSNYADNDKVSYFSPNLGGFSFGFSWTDGGAGDEGTDQSIGGSYTLPDMMNGFSLKLTVASFDNGEGGDSNETNVSYGAAVGFNDLSLTLSTADYETGAGGDRDATEFGIGYSVSDKVSVGAAFTNSDDNVAGHSGDFVSVSGEYVVVPGLSAVAAFNTYDVSDATYNRSNDGSVMVLSLQGNF